MLVSNHLGDSGGGQEYLCMSILLGVCRRFPKKAPQLQALCEGESAKERLPLPDTAGLGWRVPRSRKIRTGASRSHHSKRVPGSHEPTSIFRRGRQTTTVSFFQLEEKLWAMVP